MSHCAARTVSFRKCSCARVQLPEGDAQAHGSRGFDSARKLQRITYYNTQQVESHGCGSAANHNFFAANALLIHPPSMRRLVTERTLSETLQYSKILKIPRIKYP